MMDLLAVDGGCVGGGADGCSFCRWFLIFLCKFGKSKEVVCLSGFFPEI